ncbi:pyridoxamine 5'-phosphate oxidase family protein [Marinifilum sp. N1E240]|uniref:pyridoxamine 5'-phosphate oxidase family protein n=1 Tax=Marinifilum sp. N1E240 TaxID=2608082 RepID=UPI00128B4E17|nr:pyridoxamine 5'-phosphate oxidase family protein [Marinifilum sp. N1E240]MPQ48448.1 pyridoxamine 5'-phosphate oxidase family protein [Marinifilum sp. N1E240]
MKTVFIEGKEQIEEIIRSCDICNLGVVDAENKPYVVPMNFGYYDEYIYLHGADFGKLIDCMKAKPEVCITFCTPPELAYQDVHIACSYRMKGKSVVARGKIEFITDYDQKVDALNILMGQYTDKKFTYNSPAVRNVEVYRLKPEELTAKEFGAPHGNNFPWQVERDKKKSQKDL